MCSRKTHLTIYEGPGTRDFVMSADPVVDGLGRLGQVNLRGGRERDMLTSQIDFQTGSPRFLRIRGKRSSWSPLAGRHAVKTDDAPRIAHLDSLPENVAPTGQSKNG